MHVAFEAIGLQTEVHPFVGPAHLYADLALHFGLACVASAVAPKRPALALGAHLLSAYSYLTQNQRQGYVLGRLLPWRTSRNVVATLPAIGVRRLRVVFVGHADAAYTGLLFSAPLAGRPLPSGPLARPLGFAWRSLLALAALDAAALVVPQHRRVWDTLRGIATIPAALTALLNLEVVARNEVVPGANDNLTGCVATALLARRLITRRPDGVECVFVVTGAEEASLVGADALARRMARQWSPRDTVVVGLDSLGNGALRWFQEGELFDEPTDPRLAAVLNDLTQSDPRFGEIQPFRIPVGGTDVVPFLKRGYAAVTLGAVDPALGTPAHYHQRSDTPANLDLTTLPIALDWAEALVEHLADSWAT